VTNRRSLPVFIIEINERPTAAFEAHNQREAFELCREAWLKEDLAGVKSGGIPLGDGKTKMKVRYARPDKATRYAEANGNRQPSEDVLLLFLVELDASFD
jgi:hypothetical protein